jgi:predicted RNA-binding protein
MGQVIDSAAFQVKQFPGFKPWRRKIRYERVVEADIQALIERLSFIKNKTKWGAAFRFGFLQITKSDFTAIAKRMRPHSPR